MNYRFSIGDPESYAATITAAYTVVDAYTLTYDKNAAFWSQIENNPNPIYVSNDGGETWIDTGYVVIVKQGQ